MIGDTFLVLWVTYAFLEYVGSSRFLFPFASLEVVGWPRSLRLLALLEVIDLSRFLFPLASLKVIGLWPQMTSCDFDYLFWKACGKSVILMYNLSYFLYVQNLTYFWDFWPWMTSGDLATTLFEKLTSRASFWYINSLT